MNQTYRDTLPGLLLRNARNTPSGTALREKEWGVWQTYTWKDSLALSACFAEGLKALGLGKGDIVPLIGDNRPEWLWAELAVQSLGGMALGLYQDAPAEEIGYIFELAKAKLVVAEDQEQVDKLLSLKPNLPDLKYIVYHDCRGMASYTEPGLMEFMAVVRLGQEGGRTGGAAPGGGRGEGVSAAFRPETEPLATGSDAPVAGPAREAVKPHEAPDAQACAASLGSRGPGDARSFLASGLAVDSAVAAFEKRLETLSPDDPCLIATTSGTTGRPKLALLSHANLLGMAHNLGLADPKKASDEFVSFLPLAWMGEQMMSVASALLFGFKVNFPEEPNTVQENIREIAPHVLFSPPRVWENMAARVRVKIMETTPFKRWLFTLFMPVGERWAQARFENRAPSLGLRLAYAAAWLCLFRALKDRLGFTNIRSACTGGAALGPDTFKFFHAMGVNLKQIYGQTEIAGISCIHQDGKVDFTSVGSPIPETEIRISDEGEILSRSPAVFLGYYKNDAATAETVQDGWLRSGDAGYFDEVGRLVVIDRLKDVMTMKNGTRFSPQFVENKLKFSPYVKEAVVFGRGQEHLAAIVCLDAEIAGRWAESRQITYTTYQDLSAREEVHGLIRQELQGINAQLPPETRVTRFALLFKELDADDGELTRTRKVRRQVVEERYAALVQALFSGEPSIDLTAEIVYQDGRRRSMGGLVRIESA